MEFFEVIEKRHSYRGAFKDQGIPEGDIKKMLDAALRAPSGLNHQTTSFIVVTDPQLRAKLNEIFPHKGIGTAPVIVIALSEYKEVYQGMAFEIHDYAAAVENLLLAAVALGYAAVWTDGESKDGTRQKAIAELFHVPDHLHVQALIPMGVPEKEGKQAAKKPFDERVCFNGF